MKTLPRRLLLARTGMGNADKWYLLIMTPHFPAVVPRSTRSSQDAGQSRFNVWLSPLCLQWFVRLFDYSLLSNSRRELQGGLFVCLFVLGGCLGFISQISSLGFSVFPSDRRLLHQKGFFHHSEFIHSECIDSIHLDQGGHPLDFSPFPLAEGERRGNQIFILNPSNLTQMPQVYQGLSKPF